MALTQVAGGMIASGQTIASPTLTSPTLSSPVTSGTPTGVGVLTSSTAQASTSGTSITFSSIPSWVKRITVMFNGVSSSSTGWLQVQLGTGGTPQITGYTSTGTGITAGTLSTVVNNATGFGLVNEAAAAAAVRTGTFVLTNISGNTWMANMQYALTNVARINWGAGSVALSGTLDTIRIIASATGNPADTFDAGSINILYE